MPKQARYDVEDPQALVDRIATEENLADRAAMDRYVVNPLKRGATAIKDAVIGTPEQNRAAAARMKAQDEKNPNTFQAKVNRFLGYGGYDEAPEGKKKGGKVKAYKAGGTVSSASKRADGCCTKGKTRGRMI
jgi:hypothetical protein